jgi:hypothetical protein
MKGEDSQMPEHQGNASNTPQRRYITTKKLSTAL